MANIQLSGPIPSAMLTAQPDTASLKDSIVLIPGGAQGLGAKIARQCTAAGARVTITNINDTKGQDLALALRTNVQFVHCDVTRWSDQVQAVKAAIRFAPGGGGSAAAPTLDYFVINTSIIDKPFFLTNNLRIINLDSKDPPKLNTRPINVNIKGTIFNLKLAQLYITFPPIITI
ncbi:hypothetical protein KVR01_013260 [Diaporthe batatas]|uniref:uncharacterized protein n=1 Tax=Diaporthe batatas TaxID=748121 RepID=UPI001D04B51C|nr:uncharacterized protein KVR01_013260 [Diaporthe batatas]KAG8156847.1 hypothetical protein KVR01_013260 [Diaporthe batatas]